MVDLILPKALPAAGSVAADAAFIMDNGAGVFRVTAAQIVAAVPLPSVVYSTLGAFKAAPIANKAQSLQDPSIAFGQFNWETANAPYVADNINIIKADSTALSVGAWVRQNATQVTFSIGRSMADRMKFEIALPDAMQSNDSDENNALASLLDDGYRKLRLPAAKGFGDLGHYLLETMAGTNNLVSGAALIGDGPGRTFITRPYALVDQEVDAGASGLGQIFFANGPSADPADNITDLTFSGFTLIDDLPGYGTTAYADLERLRGYREGANCIFLNGVSRALLEQLQFIGFRGDGICLGSGHTDATEKHNREITLRDIYMDGFDRNTRNGLSVIDCDGLLVENFYGKNTTRSGDGTNDPTDPFNPNVGLGNPGLIDCEPDHAWNIIRNITMRGIRGESCGGSTVALLLRDQDVIDVPHQHFNIDLTSENCDQGFSFNGYATTAIGDADAIPYHVNVRGSVKGATKAAWQLSGLHRGRIALAVQDSADAHLGYDGLPTVGNRDVDLSGSSFVRGGNVNGNAIAIDASTRNCAIERIEFDDCGKADGSVGRCTFIRNGAHDVLRINENLVTNVSRMTQAFGVVGGFAGSIDNMTCQKNGNVLKFTPANADNFKPTGVGYGEIAAVNVNPASIATGALSTPFTLTVTGARVGDLVVASAVPYMGDKMELFASVSADDTVSVWIRNDTAGAVDLPATDFYVQVTTRPGR
jgi:hypothetical protein